MASRKTSQKVTDTSEDSGFTVFFSDFSLRPPFPLPLKKEQVLKKKTLLVKTFLMPTLYSYLI